MSRKNPLKIYKNTPKNHKLNRVFRGNRICISFNSKNELSFWDNGQFIGIKSDHLRCRFGDDLRCLFPDLESVSVICQIVLKE